MSRINGHHYRCPNYEESKSLYQCSICGEGIQENEEYIRNENDEYVHYECIYDTKWLLEWLGHEIEIMDDN